MDAYTESSGIDTSPDMNSSSDFAGDFQSPDRISMLKPRTLTYDETDDGSHNNNNNNNNNNNIINNTRLHANKSLYDEDEPLLHRPPMMRNIGHIRTLPRPPLNSHAPRLNIESPPYRKVRALRLFDTPATPKTIIKKSEVELMSANKAKPPNVCDRPKAIPIHNKVLDSISANINPFSPSSGFLQNKKRLRNDEQSSILKNSKSNSFESLMTKSNSPVNSTNENEMQIEASLIEDERQAPKRLALQDSSIPRYEKEFIELSLIGLGEFGVAYQCLNRLDGCVYAIKRSIKPVAGSVSE